LAKPLSRFRDASFRFAYKNINRLENLLGERSIEVLVDEELERRIEPNRKTVLYIGIRYDYGAKNLGLSFEHHNFFNTIINMNLNYIYFDYDRLKQQFDFKKLNSLLREALFYYQPDYLFYFHYRDWIGHDLWEEASSELPLKTIIWLADDHWRYEETRPVWELFDVVATTDKNGYERRRKEGFDNTILTQWGCNHFLYRNLVATRNHDVVFVGRNYGERKAFIDNLRAKGIDIECYGEGWENGGRVTQADLVRIYNHSKITLNMSSASKNGVLQIKGRDFEAPGCGTLLITKYNEEIKEYFALGKEIVTYHDELDAAQKIRYYLDNEQEREQIADAGYRRVLQDHTIEKRLADIFAFAASISKKS
jgi:spore maturation protein CgeB